MFELLWLLLPAAAFSGWLAGRKGNGGGGAGNAPDGYFQGLNYLLNEQPDKAIEVFIRMAEVDSSTAETHLALGSLFRRRGEVDRAIRIHQNLIARPSLTREQRAHALLELGEDYMRAGLLDRAENLFDQVVQSGVYVESALRQLLVLYQQVKEWEKAISVGLRLERYASQSVRPLVAQFYCEQAEQARPTAGAGVVRQLLKQALAHDPGCVRASLMLAELEQKQGKWKAALKCYLRIKDQDPDFLPEVLAPLRTCYQTLDQMPAFVRFLREMIPLYKGPAPALMLAELIHERDGPRAAADFLAQQLRESPSLRGLSKYIALSMEQKGADSPQGELQTLQELVRGMLGRRSHYECGQCGFSAKTLYWQCPSCRSWATVKPLRGVKIE